jgi:hypothetical protein
MFVLPITSGSIPPMRATALVFVAPAHTSAGFLFPVILLF